MPRTRTPQQPIGKWNIETITPGDLNASIGLREPKSVLEVKLPKSEFTRSAYSNIAEDLLGVSIPIGFGVVKGATAYPINPLTKRFKWLGHSVLTADSFYNGDNVLITPDSINLSTAEFTYSAWDGSEDLFVDYTADLDNPVDVAKELLTGTVRGGSLALSLLDTTSTGKGFGSTGARTKYIRGTIPATGAEVSKYPIGLHVAEPTEIKKLLSKIQEASFGYIYVDYNNLWQFKPWRPVPGEGLLQITENIIVGEIKPRITVADAVTKVIAKYRINQAFDTAQRVIRENDEERQLRGWPSHKVLEKDTIISDRDGATDWAEKTRFMFSRPRRIYQFQATSELKLSEPGDYVRLTYAPQNIDQIIILTKVRRNPGATVVNIEAIDNYGFLDKVGFYTAIPPLSFPASVGGGTFSDWTDADTDAKKQWVRENWAIYHNSNGYVDETTPLLGYKEAIYW